MRELADKRILITGHTGFKGTWMCLLTKSLSEYVYGFSLPKDNSYVTDFFFHQVDPQIYNSYYGDVSDYSCVYNAIENSRPEIIIHMASHSSLYRSMEIPHHILQTNMMGTLNVLEAARNVDSVKIVLIVTSDKVYRNVSFDTAYSEESSFGGEDPYSTSKIVQEMLANCYYSTFGMDGNFPIIATARASNCIGPGDGNGARLLPYLINTYLKGEQPVIRNPESVRAWQSVLDVNKGYISLVEYLYNSRDILPREQVINYNIGPGEDGFHTVGELAELVREVFDGKKYIVESTSSDVVKETPVLKLDSAKAYHDFGWKANISFKKAVQSTAEFYLDVARGRDVATLARKYLDID